MIVFIVLISLSLCPRGAISVANLRHFETLSSVAVTSRIKRAADGTRDLFTQVKFHAFNRDFDVTLKSDTHLLAKDFQARLVHQDGSYSILYLDESLIFSGHLTDQPTVRVHAHIEDTLWSIQVFEHTDIYAVEPAWRLLTPAENPRNDTLIAYRASDLTSDSFNSSQFCGVHDHETVDRQHPRVNRPTQEPMLGHIPDSHSYSTGSRRREKRLSSSGSVCQLFIVGDYTFFKGRCKANHGACLALMVANVKMADAIFETTELVGKDYKVLSVGLEVKELILYSSYSLSPNGSVFKHFNAKEEWTAGAKLDAFAAFTSYMTYDKDICASHLFTDYPFPARVLGLAWMMTICLETLPGMIKKNSGLTSGTESSEGPIPSLQMNLVFAHELGHTFGSEHDPKTAECSAPDSMGGNFIMWSKSVSGKNANNMKFSPCSRRHISSCIADVKCLTRRSDVVNFCGDGIIDGKEQCDAGASGVIDTDNCCTNDCKFRGHAKCSDLNHACCKNCSMSSAGTLCIAKDSIECEEASYCTGQSYDCPDPVHMADWTHCKDRGQCYRGVCRSFCEALSIKHGLNLKGCLCQTNDRGAACKWCCFHASDPEQPGPCVVHSNDTVHDGRPCYLGHCQKGVCESETASTIRRLKHYLPPLSTSTLGKFMRTNIVASVIVLSLIIWLPAVIFAYVKDKREQRLKPALAIEYETDVHKHRTTEYKARKQMRRKRRREEKEAAMSRDINDRRKSLLFSIIHELGAKKSPAHYSRSPEEKYIRNMSPRRSPQFLQ